MNILNNKSVQKLFIDILSTCSKHGISLEFSSLKYILYHEEHISGLFDEDKKMIKVAAFNKPEKFLEILIHEYCHLLQFVENCEAWRLAGEKYYNDFNACCLLDDWMNKKIKLTTKQVDECIFRVANVERDCELRVVNLIKKYNLPMDLDKYAQKANAYIKGHFAFKYYKRWFPKNNHPSQLYGIWKRMPKEIIPLINSKGKRIKFNKEELSLFDVCFK